MILDQLFEDPRSRRLSAEEKLQRAIERERARNPRPGTSHLDRLLAAQRAADAAKRRDLAEFAPDSSGDDGGDDGFSEETLKKFAAQWYNGDEDPQVEKTLMAAGWEIGHDEGYDDEPGVFVVQAGDINGHSFISWPANELRQGVAEGKQPGKSVVDAILRVMPVAQEIWFHGSRATGKHRRNSDTDILVVVPDNLVGEKYLGAVRILQKLNSHFDNYDVQPTKTGTNIHRIAQEEGRLLWSKQGVAEAFDNPYKGKWEKSESGSYDMLVPLPDGTNLSIMFNNEGGGEYQVEFYRNNSQEVTGEGDAQRIFATVLNAIQKFIKKYKPLQITFSASKEIDMDADDSGANFNPESRAKLYTRLVDRYAASLGYNARHFEHGNAVTYELTQYPSDSPFEEQQLDELSFLGSELREDRYMSVEVITKGGRRERRQVRLSPSTQDPIRAIMSHYARQGMELYSVDGRRVGAGALAKNESRMSCPECGGPIFKSRFMAEEQDACYHKVRSRYKVWPSAYASGALVQCRKKGAANWGTGGKKK